MHIKAGTTGAEGSDVWSDESCRFEIVEAGLTAAMTCTCDSLKDDYYSLVIDKNEEVGIICPGDPECVDEAHRRQAPEDRKWSWLIQLSVIVPLFLMGTIMPILLIRCDKRDYNDIENNNLKMSPALMKKFQVARGISCIQKVYYKEKQLHSYLDFEEVDDGNTGTVMQNTFHPFISLIKFYDYRMSRIVRFTFILG